MLDTRLKSNRKLRTILTILFLMILVAGNLFCFPALHNQAKKLKQETAEEQEKGVPTVRDDLVSYLYYGCYVLYAESMQQENSMSAEEALVNKGSDVWGEFIRNYARCFFQERDEPVEYTEVQTAEYNAFFCSTRLLGSWVSDLWLGVEGLAYYTRGNTGRQLTNLNGLIDNTNDVPSEDQILEAAAEKSPYWMLKIHFDAVGSMTVTAHDGENGFGAEEVEEMIQNFHQEQNMISLVQKDVLFNYYSVDDPGNINMVPIKNFTVYYFVPRDGMYNLLLTDSDTEIEYDDQYRLVSVFPYVFSMIVLMIWAALMTSRTIWRDITGFSRKGYLFLAEIGATGAVCSCLMYAVYCKLLGIFITNDVQNFPELWPFTYSDVTIWGHGVAVASVLYGIFLVVYLSLLCFRPLFSLGIVRYVKEYSLIWTISVFLWRGCRKLARGAKKRWRDFCEEVNHLDFSGKPIKIILKIVLINFAILVFLICFWLLGLVGLVIYSVGLFFLMKHYFDRLSWDYGKLSAAMSKMASGDLSEPKTEDMGVFNPMQQELTEIRSGFRRAVDQEVKSQKMKTELITNVSHDLKTPLTAITTYVELLKKPDITEEERAAYIETLERKSLRLKILIEDLFEVSKAQSENVSLELMNVDLVNLMRQVAVEHEDHFRKKQIELRWRLPEEKVVLLLDNQKTYRIFENLFINIEKYAMPGSRVYVEVARKEDSVRVVMKNISAAELNVAPEELTERFVRGDKSRNTEGSGLGLAIARSFTELQKGEFQVEVDGDLFKVTLVWKK